MEQGVTLYPIVGVAADWDDEPFDESKLPATILPGVTIENVSKMFKDDAWDLFQPRLSQRGIQTLKDVEHSIVHRFNPGQSYVNGEIVNPELKSRQLIERVAACLRLIRPTKQFAMPIHGSIRPDQTIDVRGFEEPCSAPHSNWTPQLGRIRASNRRQHGQETTRRSIPRREMADCAGRP